MNTSLHVALLVVAVWAAAPALPAQSGGSTAPGPAPNAQPAIPLLSQSIEVVGGPADVAASGSITSSELSVPKLRDSTTILVADPLRAVQSLSAVAPSDEFGSGLFVHGAGTGRTGVYLDGILLHQPHNLAYDGVHPASVAFISSGALSGVTLFPGTQPGRMRSDGIGLRAHAR